MLLRDVRLRSRTPCVVHAEDQLGITGDQRSTAVQEGAPDRLGGRRPGLKVDRWRRPTSCLPLRLSSHAFAVARPWLSLRALGKWSSSMAMQRSDGSACPGANSSLATSATLTSERPARAAVTGSRFATGFSQRRASSFVSGDLSCHASCTRSCSRWAVTSKASLRTSRAACRSTTPATSRRHLAHDRSGTVLRGPHESLAPRQICTAYCQDGPAILPAAHVHMLGLGLLGSVIAVRRRICVTQPIEARLDRRVRWGKSSELLRRN